MKKKNWWHGCRLSHRISINVHSQDSRSVNVTDSDGCVMKSAIGRSDGGSDETSLSHKLAQNAAVHGIENISGIKPGTLQVALNAGEEDRSMRFSP